MILKNDFPFYCSQNNFQDRKTDRENEIYLSKTINISISTPSQVV